MQTTKMFMIISGEWSRITVVVRNGKDFFLWTPIGSGKKLKRQEVLSICLVWLLLRWSPFWRKLLLYLLEWHRPTLFPGLFPFSWGWSLETPEPSLLAIKPFFAENTGKISRFILPIIATVFIIIAELPRAPKAPAGGAPYP